MIYLEPTVILFWKSTADFYVPGVNIVRRRNFTTHPQNQNVCPCVKAYHPQILRANLQNSVQCDRAQIFEIKFVAFSFSALNASIARIIVFSMFKLIIQLN